MENRQTYVKNDTVTQEALVVEVQLIFFIGRVKNRLRVGGREGGSKNQGCPGVLTESPNTEGLLGFCPTFIHRTDSLVYILGRKEPLH